MGWANVLGIRNKESQTGWLNGNVFLIALEAGSGGSRCRQGWLLREALRETVQAPLLASGGLLAIQAFSRFVDIYPVSAFIFTWHSAHFFCVPLLFFLKDTTTLDLGPTWSSNHGWTAWVHLYMIFFQLTLIVQTCIVQGHLWGWESANAESWFKLYHILDSSGGLVPWLMRFSRVYFCKDLIFKQGHILKFWGHLNF